MVVGEVTEITEVTEMTITAQVVLTGFETFSGGADLTSGIDGMMMMIFLNLMTNNYVFG